jgi:hypothetical protein
MARTIRGVKETCYLEGFGTNVSSVNQGGAHLMFCSKKPFTYSHLVLGSKFPMLPNATRKGILKYNMPNEVQAHLIFAIEDRQMYLVD